jgi:hypothetical protein
MENKGKISGMNWKILFLPKWTEEMEETYFFRDGKKRFKPRFFFRPLGRNCEL